MSGEPDRRAAATARAAGWPWWGLMAASLVLIGVFTLTPAGGEVTSDSTALVLDGALGLQDFIANIVLFVPLGIALGGLGVRPHWALLAACVLSFAVETTQFLALPGRDASAGDVLSNTLGGTLGAGAVVLAPLLLWPTRRAARWLAAAGAVSGAAVFGGTIWLCDLGAPGGVLLGQWSGGSWPGARPAALQVIRAEANGVPIDWGTLKSADAVRQGVRERRLQLRVTGRVGARQPGDPMPRLVGVMDVTPAWGRQLFMLQRWDDDLLFIPRARAEDYLLRSPWIRLRHVFAPPVGDTITILVHVDGNSRAMWARRGDREWSGRMNAIFAGWMLVVPTSLTPRGAEGAFVALWLLLLITPGAYWSWRAARPSPPAAADVVQQYGG